MSEWFRIPAIVLGPIAFVVAVGFCLWALAQLLGGPGPGPKGKS